MKTKTGIGVVCMEGEDVEKYVCHQVGIIWDKEDRILYGDSDPGCNYWGIRLAHCLTLDVNQILIAWKRGVRYK